MDMTFLEIPRQVTFDWHITQVLNWLKFDNGRKLDSVLVYASLDLRTAIERYIFEFLALLKGGYLSTDEKQRCRSINGIFDLMRETDPFYRKTANFTKIIASITPELPEITIVDTSYLKRKWEELSNYCHKQLEPQESYRSPNNEFQDNGFKLIEEVISRFKDWKFESVCGICIPDTMPEETRYVYDKYVNNEINDEQAKRMLKIMDPILRTRFRLRHL